jgi:hypothetical protein
MKKAIALTLISAELIFILAIYYRLTSRLAVKLNLQTRIVYWLNLVGILSRAALLFASVITDNYILSRAEEYALWLIDLTFFAFYISLFSRVCLSRLLKTHVTASNPLHTSQLLFNDSEKAVQIMKKHTIKVRVILAVYLVISFILILLS